MRHPASHRVDAVLCGVIIAAIGAVFWLVFLGLVPRAAEVKDRPVPLRDWSTGRIMAELGEWDQRLDCAQLGAPGLTAYVFVRQGDLIFVCKP